MATGLATFMDGYNTFMETKSGEFWKEPHCRALNWLVSRIGSFIAENIALASTRPWCVLRDLIVSTRYSKDFGFGACRYH
jgi:hypothetical protein